MVTKKTQQTTKKMFREQRLRQFRKNCIFRHAYLQIMSFASSGFSNLGSIAEMLLLDFKVAASERDKILLYWQQGIFSYICFANI